LIIKQVKKYEAEEYGKHKGLAECGFMVRKNNDKTRQMNECWWSEYCYGCRRDQIPFMYAVDKVGARLKMIPEYYQAQSNGTITRGGITEIVPHSYFEGNFNDPNK
jgi:hypothetical protein